VAVLVSVVIPNLNGEKLLPVCLDTLKTQTFQDFEVIVVDNGSSDRSLHLLRKKYPDVRIISLDRNYGFAFPVNRGIEAASGEFICLLNNDVELDSRWMEALYDALQQHPEVGACGPKMMRYWERERINILGIRINLNGDVEIIGAGEHDRGQYEEIRYVFGVNAGASMYRRKIFEDVGFFDETFFASFEDVDLSFRAQLAGYKALYVPRSIAYHMVGATIKKRRYQPTYLNNRNALLFFWKGMPGELFKKHFWRIFCHKAGYGLKRILINFYKVRTYYYLKGVISALIRIPSVLRARKEVQANRRVSLEYLISIMDKDFL
jgi:GT2 family glycosyltransferase